jgi:colicin import membrane protein
MNINDIMNDIAEPGTQIAEYSRTAAALSELRTRLAGIVYDVTTTAGMAAAKRDRAEVRDLRTGLERERVRIKAPALERCRLIDAEAKTITAELEALESPIDDQIKAEECRKEAEKQEKINREFARVEAIQTALHELHMESAVTGKSSAQITERLEAMRALVLDPLIYQEMMPQAQIAKGQAIDKLVMALDAAKYAEAEAAKVEAERKELAELRRLQAEQKAKDEAAAAELRKAEAAKAAAELAAQRAEQARQDAEAKARREEEDRIATQKRAEAQAQHEAEMKRQADLAAEARRLADEAAAKELAKKRKAEAADKKLRDAAPVMLDALRLAVCVLATRPEFTSEYEACDKAIKAAT